MNATKLIHELREATAGFAEHDEGSEIPVLVVELRAIADSHDAMLAALLQAEIAVEQLCHGQDPANQCWYTLAQIGVAIRKAGGR